MKKDRRFEFIKELLFILILGLAPLLWYKKGFIALGHDMFFPLNPILNFLDRLYIWTEIKSFGADQSLYVGAFFIHGLEAFIKWLGFSIFTTQKITFIFWLVAPGLAMYYFMRSLHPKREEEFLRLFASIFYMFNHFLLQGWFVAERTKFSLFVATPLVLALIIKAVHKEISIYKAAAVSSIVFFFFNGGGFIPLYGGTIIVMLLSFVYFLILSSQNRELLAPLKITGLFFLIISGFAGINSYWIIPQINLMFNAYSSVLGSIGGMDSLRTWIDEISKNASFLNLFRLQGIPEWYTSANHPYAKFYLENYLIVALSFILPFLAYYPLAILKKVSHKQKEILFYFIFLSLVSLFFIKGTHAPFGSLYFWAVKHIPYFAIFRTPFYKFALPLWFAYAYLTGFSLNFIIKNISAKATISKPGSTGIKIIAVIFILFYNWPFFTGNFFIWNKPQTTMVKVPDYVFSFENWVDNNNKDGRVLLLPKLNGGWRFDIYNWQYFSKNTPLPLISNKSFIINDESFNKEQGFLIDSLYDAIDRQDSSKIKKLCALMNIRYFLLRKDVAFDLKGFETDFPLIIESKLKPLVFLRHIKDFGEWVLYELDIADEFIPFNLGTDRTTLVAGDFNNDMINALLSHDFVNKDNPILFLDHLDLKPGDVFNLPDVIPKLKEIVYYRYNNTDLVIDHHLLNDNLSIRPARKLGEFVSKAGRYTIFVNTRYGIFKDREKWISLIIIDGKEVFLGAIQGDKSEWWYNLEIPLAEGRHSLGFRVKATLLAVPFREKIPLGDPAVKESGAVEVGLITSEKFNAYRRNLEDSLRDVEKQYLSGEKSRFSSKFPRSTAESNNWRLLNYTKINPTSYLLEIEADSPFWLTFNEGFNRQWNAYIAGGDLDFKGASKWRRILLLRGKSTQLITRHYPVNIYYNGWYIDESLLKKYDHSGKGFKIILDYAPQHYFEIGLVFSFVALLGCSLPLILRRNPRL